MEILDVHSADLENDIDMSFMLPLSDADRKQVGLVFDGNMGMVKLNKRDALSGEGKFYYQLEFRPPGHMGREYKVDLLQLTMNEQQADTYFNAVKSMEIGRIRREMRWLKWMMAIGMLLLIVAAVAAVATVALTAVVSG